MGNTKFLKILWSAVGVIFLLSAGFLAYDYFSEPSSQSKKTEQKSDSKDSSSKNNKSKKSSSKKTSDSTESSTEKSNTTNNEQSSSSEKKESSNNSTTSNTEKKTDTKDNQNTSNNNDNKDASIAFPAGNNSNGKTLAPGSKLGSSGQVFGSQKEAMDYGRDEITKLVKEDKKERSYSVSRVTYSDGSSGWTVDITAPTNNSTDKKNN